jgi:multidrug efflux pump
MTSLAMVFGALPLALSLGAAGTSRIPLGVVIVGGVMFSLLLSLAILPVMYALISRRKPIPPTAIDKLSD